MSSSSSSERSVGKVLEFWLGDAAETDPDLEAFTARTKFWFMRNADTDRRVRELFEEDVERARAGALDAWAETPLGRVALVILLDQFPRNLFRDSPRAFASDARAREISLAGLEAGADRNLRVAPRFMLYMPLMHAEDRGLQARATELFTRLRDEAPEPLRAELSNALRFAERHKEIVDLFGRFPHRNRVLGRATTPEEEEFLKQPNSSF